MTHDFQAANHDIQSVLEAGFRDAIARAYPEVTGEVDPLIRPSTDPKFGDFQSNAAMGMAKRDGVTGKPREVAERIVGELVGELVGGLVGGAGFAAVDSLEIAGPGFINIRLAMGFLCERVEAMSATDDSLGLAGEKGGGGGRVVIDYSGPNVAKEMHIGHLRSTIIGDALARVLELTGCEVVRQNHLGDWGTQFGMLIEHLIETGWDPSAEQSISDLNALYQAAKKHFDDDGEFAGRARKRVVALQSGDADTLKIWRGLIEESKHHFNAIYARLGVLLTDDDIRPESFYNDKLEGVIESLEASGLLHESEGASVVYPAGYTDRDGNRLGMIVKKSDGGFGYAATDLAAVRYRVEEMGADRVVYVVDARQKDHFGQFFWAAKEAGWLGEEKGGGGGGGGGVGGGGRADYVPFGTIMGKDRKPFKTRSGETVKLSDVLVEAVERAEKVIAAKNPELPEQDRKVVAEAVGLGGIKYADLSNDRIKDYIFDWDRMLALEGNTAPYLQYSYARIRSIFRKAEAEGVLPGDLGGCGILLDEAAERAIALHLLRFPRVINSVAESLEPHRLCTYLYEMATLYHQFYEKCPVLKAGDAEVRASRLRLCELVGRTLKKGLGLLGIQTVERM